MNDVVPDNKTGLHIGQWPSKYLDMGEYQAGAIRQGIACALLQVNPDYRATLKAAGFLTRDVRMQERKKYALKDARCAPQFSKR